MAEIDQYDFNPEMALDPGIRHYVLVLRSGGIETFESCEGGDGRCFSDTKRQ